MSDRGDTLDPSTGSVDPSEFPPKPPIWRGVDRGPISARRMLLSGAGVLLLFGLFGLWGFSWIEENFFATNPQRAVLRVIRMDGNYPGSRERLTTHRYLVALPDGTEAHRVSERFYRVGTRLEANTARGRITGRVLVGGPYITLAE